MMRLIVIVYMYSNTWFEVVYLSVISFIALV